MASHVRLGRISYVNMAPVFYRLEADVEEVSGVPTELSRMLLDGQLDIAPIPSIEYARNADSLRILPRLCVSSEGAVDSIQLVSRIPFAQVRSVAVTPESATSVVLVRILIPKAEIVPLGTQADATLLIGDAGLPEAPGIDIAAYRAELGRRWSNPRIQHRLEQIGADGSQKLPARFAGPARERLEAGAPPRWIALVMAAWAHHLKARDGGLPVRDPGAKPVQEALARANGHGAEAAAVLAVLGDEVASSEPMLDLVSGWLKRLDTDGIAGALREGLDSA